MKRIFTGGKRVNSEILAKWLTGRDELVSSIQIT